MRTIPLVVILLLTAIALPSQEALAFNKLKKCGKNDRCYIVDVLDRTPFNATVFSSARVTEAWKKLIGRGCGDVRDIVVGGTFGENGAPGSSIPGGFAKHIGRRCTIVVHYELEGPVIDAQAYEDSTEHGRKALAIVLNEIDSIRKAEHRKPRMRVWGHSKGAAIVESMWMLEAHKAQKKYITTMQGKRIYVDACPTNNCRYFGFGYPYTMEKASRFSISRQTAAIWSSRTKGKIAKPSSKLERWYRLTTFTNKSDPIYTCNLSCAWQLMANSNCHRYENFTSVKGYDYLYAWNDLVRASPRPASVVIGNLCGG